MKLAMTYTNLLETGRKHTNDDGDDNNDDGVGNNDDEYQEHYSYDHTTHNNIIPTMTDIRSIIMTIIIE